MVSMRAKRVWGIVYLGLLAVSGIWKTFFPFSISPMPEQESVTVSIDESANSEVEIRFLDTKREIPDSRPSIVLLHGSPMAYSTFDTLLPHLSDKYRLIVPDLPGFGRSQRSISDYSITAHGLYLEKLLDELQVTECHLVGYSMGGGVAVELCDSRPTW